MATLRLENVVRCYGRANRVVDGVSLSVKEGEFLVLLGPSGCGKTTTLRLIAGLDEVSSGNVFIAGRRVTFLPSRLRNVSMVFQNYAVWPHMTVYDNVAFPLKLRKLAPHAIRDAVEKVTQLTKISDFLQRFPSQLSGGQQQRVALARALAVEPDVFLMDEPFSNLDAALRVDMRTELKAIHQQTRATTVFVTHDQAEAMSMADRIAIMHHGRVVQIGTPDDVYFRPASVFVAGFVGTPTMNFFRLELRDTRDGVRLVHPCFEFPASDVIRAAVERTTSKKHLILGVRPEDIVLVPSGQALFSTEARVVEPQGSHQIVAIALDGQTSKLTLPPTPKIQAGTTVHLDFRRERVHVFDPSSRKRL